MRRADRDACNLVERDARVAKDASDGGFDAGGDVWRCGSFEVGDYAAVGVVFLRDIEDDCIRVCSFKIRPVSLGII